MVTEKSAEGFTLYEIQKDDENLINPVLSSTGVVSNFTCFPQLYAYLTKSSNHLYIVNFREKPRIILHRNSDLNDIRIMFSKEEKDEEFIEKIKKQFSPKYIAYNLIPEKPSAVEPNKMAIRDELILDVSTVRALDDQRVKKDYNRCKKRHPNIQYRRATPKDKKQIVDFVDRWCQRETEKRGALVTGENVKRYIELFLSEDGINIDVIIDQDKVIGITSHSSHPLEQKLAVSTFSMVDRGYKQLGVFAYVEQAKAIDAQGFTKALIGGRESLIVGGKENTSKADFKMRFMKNGSINTYYSQEVLSADNFVVGPNYLRDFWA